MDRKRSQTGTLVTKRRNTKISTIEKKYGVDLGVRSDMTLGSYLEKKGYRSLSQMLRK